MSLGPSTTAPGPAAFDTSLFEGDVVEVRQPGVSLNCHDEDHNGLKCESGQLTVVCVGDLYEDDIGSRSKSEYILETFSTKGPAACSSLNGSYVFVVIDAGSRRVFLGTDEYSFIPVYYVCHEGVLHVSWNVFDFRSVLPRSGVANDRTILGWLVAGPPGWDDEARLKGVRHLEPGSVVEVSGTGTTVHRAAPFTYTPRSGDEAQRLEQAESLLRRALIRRTRGRRRIALGLSGGIDSRIVIAAAMKEFGGEWLTYTYGREGLFEREIASDIARHYGCRHVNVVFPDEIYIDYAKDGVFYSSGESLFKHGVQAHMFAALKRTFPDDGLILGSALDLTLGSSYTPDAVFAMRSRDELFDYHRRRFFNFDVEGVRRLFRDRTMADEIYGYCCDGYKANLDAIPGDDLADVNISFIFETRVRRWYNRNLVYPLLTHRLLTPTYDKDFLGFVRTLPSEVRRDSVFRHKLLKHIDRAVAEFPHDASMRPAALLPRETVQDTRRLEEADLRTQALWFESQGREYVPSKRFEANFLESFRVYPSYRTFLQDVLLSDESVLVQRYLNADHVRSLISEHVEGRAQHHKVLVLLVSAELAYRTLTGDRTGINRQPVEFAPFLSPSPGEPARSDARHG